MLTAVDGTLGGDPTRAGDLGLASLRGHLEDTMQEMGERLFVQKIAGTIRPQARAIVKAHQRMGHVVVLASAATRFQTGPVARELGIDDILCTELEIEDGVLTGRVRRQVPLGRAEGPGRTPLRPRARRRPAARATATPTATRTSPSSPAPATRTRSRPRRALRETANLQSWPILDMPEPLRTGVRSVLGTVAAAGGLNAGLVTGAVLGAVRRDKRAGTNVGIPLACDAALALAGVKLNIVGEENVWKARPAIFIGNHQSSLDPVIMGSLLRRDFTGVSKAEAKFDPRMLAASLFLDPVFIDRSNAGQSRAALDKLTDRIRSGTSIMIFPEGTRMPTPEPGAFKKGAFHMAMQAGVPIVPVVFRNAGELLAPHATVVRPGHGRRLRAGADRHQ